MPVLTFVARVMDGLLLVSTRDRTAVVPSLYRDLTQHEHVSEASFNRYSEHRFHGTQMGVQYFHTLRNEGIHASSTQTLLSGGSRSRVGVSTILYDGADHAWGV